MGQSETKQEGLIKDARYGQAELIRKNGVIYAQKKIMITGDEQYKIWEQRKIIEHPNLIKIIDSELYTEKELCSNYQFILITLEYMPISLHKEIQQRRNRNDYFSEEELMRMLIGIVDLLTAMQLKHISHQNIRPQTLSYTRDVLKLCENQINNTAFNYVIRNPDSNKYYDLSPKLMQAIYQQNQNPRHNIYKSDVFSLGMCFLQAALLDDCRECYDFENGTIEISKYIQYLKSNYSHKFEDILMSMLQQDEESRPDFRDLYKIVGLVNENKSLEASLINSNIKQDPILINNSMVISATDSKPPNLLNNDRIDEINTNINNLQIIKAPQSDSFDTKINIKSKLSIVQKLQNSQLKQSKHEINQSSPVQQKQNENLQSIPPVVVPPKKKLGYYHFEEGILFKQQPNPITIENQSQLKTITENQVSKQLYPQEFHDYPSLDWSFSRNKERNSINSNVSNQNQYPIYQNSTEVVSLIDKRHTNNYQKDNNKYYQEQFEFKPSLSSDQQKIQQLLYSEKNQSEQYQSQQQQQSQQQYPQQNQYQSQSIRQSKTQLPYAPIVQQQIRESYQYNEPIPQRTEVNKIIQSLGNTNQKEYIPALKQSNQFKSEFKQFDEVFTERQPIYNTNIQQKNQIDLQQSKQYKTQTYTPNENLNLKPIDRPTQVKTQFRKEMTDMITMEKSRVFKSEIYQDGSKYKGESLNNMRDGFGRLDYADNGYYEGQWKMDKMNGFGTLYYGPNMKAYEGQFLDDKFDGFGTLYNKNPAKLNGTFDPSDFDQIGNCWVKFVGNFNRDLKNGQGVLYLSNNQKFSGDFKDDYIDGQGQFEDIQGYWRRNKLVK